jgi:hypothetical protein
MRVLPRLQRGKLSGSPRHRRGKAPARVVCVKFCNVIPHAQIAITEEEEPGPRMDNTAHSTVSTIKIHDETL